MNRHFTAAASRQSGANDAGPAVKPIIVRLEKILATTPNRKHIQHRLQELNRILEDAGTPFRIRLL